MKTRNTPILHFAGVLLLALALTSACQSRPGPTTLRYGLTLAPSGIDPHINASAELGIPLTSVYDTLVIRDPVTGEFLPSLATKWSVSDNGRIYSFQLREDVEFHDGTPFNAQAAVDNFEYVMNPDHHSQKAASMLGPFKRAIVLDEFTLEIQLDEPFGPLLDSLSQVYLGMASPAALEQWGVSDYQFHQVGTGPYRFVEYIPNDHITLEVNPEYAWGPAIFANEKASIERIEFTFYEDVATRALALERNEVDIVGEVPPEDALRLAEQGGYNLAPIAIPGQPLQYFLNTQIVPTNDINVRRALIASVDRERIIDTIFGSLSPLARGPLSADLFSTLLPSPPTIESFEASELLASAGWVDGDGDGVRERDGIQLAINLVAPPWGSNPEVAQLIKVDWESIGVDVNLSVVPSFGALKEVFSEGKTHAIGLNFFGSDADLLRTFYMSDGFFNFSNANAPEIDRLLLEAAHNTDMSLRNEAYRETIEHITSQALVLPIRDYVNLIVHRSTLTNLSFSAQGWFPYLIDFELDY